MGIRQRELLQCSNDKNFFASSVVFDLENVGLAAGLAVFYIVLAPAGRLIDRGGVPLAASCTLKSGFHAAIIAENAAGPIMTIPEFGFGGFS